MLVLAPIVVVGAGVEARELAELIIDHPEARFDLAGIVGNLGVAERSGLADLWIGPTGRLVELMHQHQVSGAAVSQRALDEIDTAPHLVRRIDFRQDAHFFDNLFSLHGTTRFDGSV